MQPGQRQSGQPQQPANRAAGAAAQQLLQRAQESLRHRRDEVTRMMTEMREAFHANRQQAQAEVEEFRRENQQLRTALDEKTREIGALANRLQVAERRATELEGAQQRLVADTEALLAEQNNEFGRWMHECKEMFAGFNGSAMAAPGQRQALAGDGASAAAIERHAERVRQLQQEVELLQNELHERDRMIEEAHRQQSETRLQTAPPAAVQPKEMETLRQAVKQLQNDVEQRDRTIETLREHIQSAAPADPDRARIAEYERELIQYHQQLEADRTALNNAIQQLEANNAELAANAKKAEEELARERAQLNMLRDELHIDLAFEDLAFLARKHLAPVVKINKKPGT